MRTGHLKLSVEPHQLPLIQRLLDDPSTEKKQPAFLCRIHQTKLIHSKAHSKQPHIAVVIGNVAFRMDLDGNVIAHEPSPVKLSFQGQLEPTIMRLSASGEICYVLLEDGALMMYNLITGEHIGKIDTGDKRCIDLIFNHPIGLDSKGPLLCILSSKGRMYLLA